MFGRTFDTMHRAKICLMLLACLALLTSQQVSARRSVLKADLQKPGMPMKVRD